MLHNAFPFYEEDTLSRFSNTEAVPFRSDSLRWNSSARNATTLFGHDVIDMEKTDSIQWVLRRHSLSQNRSTYSVVVLDDFNVPLASLSGLNQKPRLLSGHPSQDTAVESGSRTEDGKGMWLVIPNQGLLHIDIANL